MEINNETPDRKDFEIAVDDISVILKHPDLKTLGMCLQCMIFMRLIPEAMWCLEAGVWSSEGTEAYRFPFKSKKDATAFRASVLDGLEKIGYMNMRFTE